MILHVRLVVVCRKGSVVAEFTAQFRQPLDTNASDPDAATRAALTNALSTATNSGRLGDLSVKPGSVATMDCKWLKQHVHEEIYHKSAMMLVSKTLLFSQRTIILTNLAIVVTQQRHDR